MDPPPAANTHLSLASLLASAAVSSPSRFPSLTAISRLPLPTLRGLLQYPIPSVSRLFAIVTRLRSAFSSSLTGSDYRLLLHQLSLQHAASAAQQPEICALLLQVWDEYTGRQGQTEQDAVENDSRTEEQRRREERSVMLDVLSACARSGEGAACEHLVLDMMRRRLQVGVDELNAVLYGCRGDEQRMWRWLHSMQHLSSRLAAAPADSPSPEPEQSALYDALLSSGAVDSSSALSASPLLFALNADSLLIVLHASAQADRFLRLELLLMRGFPLPDFHLVPAAASTSLVVNQLLSFLIAVARTAPRVTLTERVAALQRLASELQYAPPVPLTPETVRASPRILSLYRWSQMLCAELTSASLQEIISRQRTELLKGRERLLVPSPTLQMLSLKRQKTEAQSRETQRRDAEMEPGQTMQGDVTPTQQTASRARPWQEVLAAYEHRVLSGHRVSLSESLTAIQACYRGRHWQRAVQVLVLPQWAEGMLERYDADEPKTQRSEEMQREAEEQHIALSPVTGCWTGPQHHRLRFIDICRQEHWLHPQPGLELRLPLSSDAEAGRSGTETAADPSSSASLVVTAATRAVLPGSASSSSSLTTSVLHYAFCIAAMDAAGNAESIRKADALHCIAMRQFPFLLHLYDPLRRCFHLHHPQLTAEGASAAALDAFVQAEQQRGDKVWSLLYLVWRLQRRCLGGGGGDDAPLLPELRRLMLSYAEGGGGGSWLRDREADGGGRQQQDGKDDELSSEHLLLRVDSVADAAAVNGVLRLQPWALDDADWSQDWKRSSLSAVTRRSSARRARADRRPNGVTHEAESRWQQGYRDMYGDAADSSASCFITRVQVKAWLQALHRQD